MSYLRDSKPVTNHKYTNPPKMLHPAYLTCGRALMLTCHMTWNHPPMKYEFDQKPKDENAIPRLVFTKKEGNLLIVFIVSFPSDVILLFVVYKHDHC